MNRTTRLTWRMAAGRLSAAQSRRHSRGSRDLPCQYSAPTIDGASIGSEWGLSHAE
jgi:hypothetical protein